MPQSAWDIILERRTPRHVHPCPICHGMSYCLMDCAIEPDLEREDGTPSGSYICCSKACALGNDEYIYEAYGHAFEPTRHLDAPPEQMFFPWRDRVSD